MRRRRRNAAAHDPWPPAVSSPSLAPANRAAPLAALRPLDNVVALKSKATGALVGETYFSVAPRPDSGDGDHCYTAKGALAAVVTVTTTPAEDRLAISVKVVRLAPPKPGTMATADDGAK